MAAKARVSGPGTPGDRISIEPGDLIQLEEPAASQRPQDSPATGAAAGAGPGAAGAAPVQAGAWRPNRKAKPSPPLLPPAADLETAAPVSYNAVRDALDDLLYPPAPEEGQMPETGTGAPDQGAGEPEDPAVERTDGSLQQQEEASTGLLEAEQQQEASSGLLEAEQQQEAFSGLLEAEQQQETSTGLSGAEQQQEETSAGLSGAEQQEEEASTGLLEPEQQQKREEGEGKEQQQQGEQQQRQQEAEEERRDGQPGLAAEASVALGERDEASPEVDAHESSGPAQTIGSAPSDHAPDEIQPTTSIAEGQIPLAVH